MFLKKGLENTGLGFPVKLGSSETWRGLRERAGCWGSWGWAAVRAGPAARSPLQHPCSCPPTSGLWRGWEGPQKWRA